MDGMYTDSRYKISISDFPSWFSGHVRGWAYIKYRQGKTLDEMPSQTDHELYAEHVGVKSHIIYNLMQFSTENIPAEVLKDLGLAVSTEVVEVIKKERVSCLVKCDYGGGDA